MVTYVLGAGASCHRGYPLTAELGNRLHEWVRQNWTDNIPWKGYIEALHTHYGGLANLESVLTELYERQPGSRAAALGETCCGQTIGALKVAIPEFFNSIEDRCPPAKPAVNMLVAAKTRQDAWNSEGRCLWTMKFS